MSLLCAKVGMAPICLRVKVMVLTQPPKPQISPTSLTSPPALHPLLFMLCWNMLALLLPLGCSSA